MSGASGFFDDFKVTGDLAVGGNLFVSGETFVQSVTDVSVTGDISGYAIEGISGIFDVVTGNSGVFSQQLTISGNPVLTGIGPVGANPGGPDFSVQFGSGDTLSGNQNLLYSGNQLSGVSGTFDNLTISGNQVLTGISNDFITDIGNGPEYSLQFKLPSGIPDLNKIETIQQFDPSVMGRTIRGLRNKPARGLAPGKLCTITGIYTQNHAATTCDLGVTAISNANQTHGDGIIIAQQGIAWELLGEDAEDISGDHNLLRDEVIVGNQSDASIIEASGHAFTVSGSLLVKDKIQLNGTHNPTLLLAKDNAVDIFGDLRVHGNAVLTGVYLDNSNLIFQRAGDSNIVIDLSYLAGITLGSELLMNEDFSSVVYGDMSSVFTTLSDDQALKVGDRVLVTWPNHKFYNQIGQVLRIFQGAPKSFTVDYDIAPDESPEDGGGLFIDDEGVKWTKVGYVPGGPYDDSFIGKTIIWEGDGSQQSIDLGLQYHNLRPGETSVVTDIKFDTNSNADDNALLGSTCLIENNGWFAPKNEIGISDTRLSELNPDSSTYFDAKHGFRLSGSISPEHWEIFEGHINLSGLNEGKIQGLHNGFIIEQQLSSNISPGTDLRFDVERDDTDGSKVQFHALYSPFGYSNIDVSRGGSAMFTVPSDKTVTGVKVKTFNDSAIITEVSIKEVS